jgi:hypothetical protein
MCAAFAGPNACCWRRGWDSNPRAACAASGFQVGVSVDACLRNCLAAVRRWREDLRYTPASRPTRELGTTRSSAPVSRTFAGTICATPGRAGTFRAGHRSSRYKSSQVGKPRRWCAVARTSPRNIWRCMPATRKVTAQIRHKHRISTAQPDCKWSKVKEIGGGQGRNRTTDTRIFSPLLYQLSYLAAEDGRARIRPAAARVVKKSRPLSH